MEGLEEAFSARSEERDEAEVEGEIVGEGTGVEKRFVIDLNIAFEEKRG